MLEKQIEKWMKRQVEQMGGLFLKFVSPSNDGVPDRIVLLPGGKIWFVELKTEDGRVSKIQEYMIGKMERIGCKVVVVHGMTEAREAIERMRGGDAL